MADSQSRNSRLAEEFEPKKAAPKEIIYVVKAGDDLHKIAKEQLGDAARWSEIAELNKATLPNPNLLRIGQELKLPAK